MNKVKICTKCKKIKDLSEFNRRKMSIDGLQPTCRFCDNERSRKYAADHREEACIKARKWVEKNRERANENKRRYRKERPDVWRKNNALRRARKNKAKIFGEVDFDKILKRDKGKCWLCRKKVAKKDLSFDHVIPLSKGGEHSERNIRVAHLSCNCSKNSKLIEHQMIMI